MGQAYVGANCMGGKSRPSDYRDSTTCVDDVDYWQRCQRKGVTKVYYVEQICNPALRSVRITIHGEQIVNAMWYRDYKAAVPGKPYVKEQVDGTVIYVDACETWEEANERAGQLAQENGTLYSLNRQLATQHRKKRRRIFFK